MEPCHSRTGGHRKYHLVIAFGRAAVEAGIRVQLFSASLVENLNRAWPTTSSAGHRTPTREDLVIVAGLGFAPLDDTWAQLLIGFVDTTYERRGLGLSSHLLFESWRHVLPEHTTAALHDRHLLHLVTLVASGESYPMKEARPSGGVSSPTS